MTGERPGAGAGAEPGPLSLVYLDVDDEITSAAARIRAAAADEVVLVLPFGSRLATSRINFRLLAREASERGKKIEVVCADASARALAIAAGLPTHASVAAFEAARSGAPGDAAGGEGEGGEGGGTGAGIATPGGVAGKATGKPTQLPLDLDDTETRVIATPRRKPERVPIVGPPRPPIRTGFAIGAGVAAIVAIIAIGLLALELLPSATIILHPRSESIGPIELSVEAREDVTAPDPVGLAIPAERFTFALEASQAFPATGIRVEDVKARGNVTFSNFDNGRGVVIPAGTVVRTEDKIEFVTLADVTLPRAQQDFFPPFSTHPSTASVSIEAVLPGPTGNVGSNTVVVIPKGARLLFVTNPDPVTGGAHNETPEVSADDVEAAKLALTSALIADLDRQVAAGEGIPDAVTLFPTTRVAGEPEWSVDPASLVGTPGAEFSLGATAEGTALGVDPAPIDGLATAVIAGRVDAGWTIADGSVAMELGTPTVVGDTIVYPFTVEATQVHDVDEAALLVEIRGLTLPAARARLDDFGDVVITVWPDWVTTIPTRTDRVTFELAEPQPSAPPS